MTTKKASTSEVSGNGVDPKVTWNQEAPSVLVFDVNETLIDFESMNPLFQQYSTTSASFENGSAT